MKKSSAMTIKTSRTILYPAILRKIEELQNMRIIIAGKKAIMVRNLS